MVKYCHLCVIYLSINSSKAPPLVINHSNILNLELASSCLDVMRTLRVSVNTQQAGIVN
jgi:hypothetical protein